MATSVTDSEAVIDACSVSHKRGSVGAPILIPSGQLKISRPQLRSSVATRQTLATGGNVVIDPTTDIGLANVLLSGLATARIDAVTMLQVRPGAGQITLELQPRQGAA